MRQVHVTAQGKVQGVGYRAWVDDRAAGLGLTGWVRNLPDGTVEAVLCGPEAQVDDMLERMRSGPAGATVEALLVRDHDGERPEAFVQHR